MGEVLDQIGKLTPTQFENLTYDLLLSLGMKNLEWRTPGADGGRDIEGEMFICDFSKIQTVEKWHIECKRYTDSVPWPTIHEKVAYGDTQKADFLLLITNSMPSPACRDEIKKWNDQKRFPRIRCWDGVKLEELILAEKAIRIKYSLSTEKHLLDLFSSPLVEVSTKVILSAYGKAAEPSEDLELAAAIGDLLLSSYSAYEKGESIVRKKSQIERDLYQWVIPSKDCNISTFDPNGLRAVLSAVRFCGKLKTLNLEMNQDGAVLLPEAKESLLLNKILTQISLSSNIEINWGRTGIILKSRTV